MVADSVIGSFKAPGSEFSWIMNSDSDYFKAMHLSVAALYHSRCCAAIVISTLTFVPSLFVLTNRNYHHQVAPHNAYQIGEQALLNILLWTRNVTINMVVAGIVS